MEELKAYIQETLPELKELIIELCGIPAPSHHEEKRAEFCRDWAAPERCVPGTGAHRRGAQCGV